MTARSRSACPTSAKTSGGSKPPALKDHDAKGALICIHPEWPKGHLINGRSPALQVGSVQCPRVTRRMTFCDRNFISARLRPSDDRGNVTRSCDRRAGLRHTAVRQTMTSRQDARKQGAEQENKAPHVRQHERGKVVNLTGRTTSILAIICCSRVPREGGCDFGLRKIASLGVS